MRASLDRNARSRSRTLRYHCNKLCVLSSLPFIIVKTLKDAWTPAAARIVLNHQDNIHPKDATFPGQTQRLVNRWV